MAKFFINRPIVAIVIAILMVIAGVVAMLGLPTAQFPNIADPQIQVNATYTGADAQTVAQSVATPIEQQMRGVDNMNYMYSLNASNGSMTLTVDFDIDTDAEHRPDPGADADLAGQLAIASRGDQQRRHGAEIDCGAADADRPLLAATEPTTTSFWRTTPPSILNDALTRVPGVASVSVFGAGQYAMRCWVKPDKLAKLGITVPEIINAIQAQNTVNPAGQIGGEPVPPGQQFTYTVRAPGPPADGGGVRQDRRPRATPDGGILRLKDVARVELGAQNYNMIGRLNGKPAALVAVYQSPGANAVQTAAGVRKMHGGSQEAAFPQDLEYDVALDTTLAVTAGMKEIEHTLVEALVLVIIVVFIFLQGWRATLIPLLAVPVSLIGTLWSFRCSAFPSIRFRCSAWCWPSDWWWTTPSWWSRRWSTTSRRACRRRTRPCKAMEEVSGPVIAIALILAAVFIPTAFIPGITGRLYQQFAVTIAISVHLLGLQRADALSPRSPPCCLRPRKESRGPLGAFSAGSIASSAGLPTVMSASAGT